ncbi:MAG TPA: hypothetical protein PKC10_11125 [Cyclobacteriaceae bacterium]|nr:hypothetical protein [Cyclobacteriaceae bacterium]
MRLNLKYQQIVQGNFSLKRTNLMMAFQVNCPGCFMHGFPLLTELQNHFGSSLNCFALSTAFEDFELNTAENTKKLLTSGEPVGETLKAYQTGLPYTISLPVLMDNLIAKKELISHAFIESVCRNVAEKTISAEELRNLQESLHNYYRQMPTCGYTFAANLMRGTPSFFLFTDTLEILAQWFGHADSTLVKEKLDMLIRKNNGQVAI